MALRDALRNLFDKFLPAESARTTEIESRPRKSRPQVPAGTIGDSYYDFVDGYDRTRRARYMDYDFMDQEVPEISRALDDHADLMVGSDEGDIEPIVIVAKDKKVETIINDLNKRTHLMARIWSISREMVKYGDDFEEIVIDDADQIVRIKGLPVKEMYRHEDEFGRLEDKAYTQRDDAGNIRAEFDAFQIVHFRSDRPRSSQYGRSLVHSARRIWRQLQLMEDGMVVGRLARAYMRYVFKIPGGDLALEDQRSLIEMYKDLYQKKKVIDPTTGKMSVEKSVLTADEDFFIPVSEDKPGDVTALEGSARIGEIRDVEYFQNKMFTRLEIPKAMMAFERDVNAKSTLGTEDKHLVRKVKRRRGIVAAGLRQVYDTQLMLFKIDPTKAEYEIQFPTLATEDELAKANVEKVRADTAKIWTELFIPIEVILKRCLNFTDEEVREVKGAIEKAKKDAEAKELAKTKVAGMNGKGNGAAPEEEEPLVDQQALPEMETWLIRRELLERLQTLRGVIMEAAQNGQQN
jgi:hypothetical protein